MTKRTRKILAYLLIGFFLMSAPLVVLYTMGFRYNRNKNKIEKTGILRVESRPSNADILLDERDTLRTTPASFFRLLPEDYRIRIEKSGFIPWEKTLTVHSEETTFAEVITLFQDVLPRLTIDGDINIMRFSPDKSRIAMLVDNNDWTELRLYTFADESVSLLARHVAGRYDDIEFSWSPQGEHLLFTGRDEDTPVALTYRITRGFETRDVADVLASPLLSARWSDTEEQILMMTRDGAFTQDLGDEDAEPALLSPFAHDVLISGTDMVLLRKTTKGVVLERAPLDDVTAGAEVKTFQTGTYSLQSVRGDHVIVNDESKQESYIVNMDGGAIDSLGDIPAVRWESATDAGRLLLCNDFEITIMDAETGSRTLITRLGTRIDACQWSPEHDHIITATEGRIQAIEIDDRGERNVIMLTNFPYVHDIEVIDETLWFSGGIGNQHGIFIRPL